MMRIRIQYIYQMITLMKMDMETYCAQIITSHCKHIEFIIIKILDQNNIGYSRALVEGVEVYYSIFCGYCEYEFSSAL